MFQRLLPTHTHTHTHTKRQARHVQRKHPGALAESMLPWYISITYSVGVFVALVIKYAKCMRRITLSSVDCPALPEFSTLSH